MALELTTALFAVPKTLRNADFCHGIDDSDADCFSFPLCLKTLSRTSYCGTFDCSLLCYLRNGSAVDCLGPLGISFGLR